MRSTLVRQAALQVFVAATLAVGTATVNVAQAQQAGSTATTGAEYRLGAGDVVRISVYQNPDLTLEARVSEGGTITYPLLGPVRIGGLGLSQAEKVISDGLRSGNFVKQPQVNMLVLQVKGHQASVLGQVNRPGRFPLDVAGLRLSDLVATAGGVSGVGADTVTIVGVRNGQTFRKEIDLPALFRNDRRDDDIVVENGDVVYVERAPQVYIYGEVQRPGAFRLERGMTVLQALATGGGLNQRGTEKGLRIHRAEANGSLRVIEPKMDELLKPGDVVFVRESLF